MLTLLPRWRRAGWWFGTVVAAALAVEMVLMVAQMIGRGRMLHFNHADDTDDLVHNLLAGGAYLAWLGAFAAAGYLGLIALTTWQALRGQSMVDPDAVTWLAAGGLVSAALIAALIAVRRPRSPRGSASPNPAVGQGAGRSAGRVGHVRVDVDDHEFR